jgi:hypothetical protein
MQHTMISCEQYKDEIFQAIISCNYSQHEILTFQEDITIKL